MSAFGGGLTHLQKEADRMRSRVVFQVRRSLPRLKT